MSHDIELDRPRLRVDFNELVCRDLVLVSAEDHKMDSSGTSIQMVEGLHVFLYSDDHLDESGRIDPLLADGVLERAQQAHGDPFMERVPWRCRIDSRGIRYLSDEHPEIQARSPIR